jgi:hypothetical protein
MLRGLFLRAAYRLRPSALRPAVGPRLSAAFTGRIVQRLDSIGLRPGQLQSTGKTSCVFGTSEK